MRTAGPWRGDGSKVPPRRNTVVRTADPFRRAPCGNSFARTLLVFLFVVVLRLPGARRSLRTAIAKDPQNWLLWLDLAAAEDGWARQRALRTALRLNPYSPEIRAFAHS